MGIFDNASSITIGDKEVKSIIVDGGVIYSKSSGDGVDVYFTITSNTLESFPIDGASILLSKESDEYTGTTDSNGECVIHNVPIGEGYYLNITADGYDSHTQSGAEISENTNFNLQLTPQTSSE